jgi:hypothetical protein
MTFDPTASGSLSAPRPLNKLTFLRTAQVRRVNYPSHLAPDYRDGGSPQASQSDAPKSSWCVQI